MSSNAPEEKPQLAPPEPAAAPAPGPTGPETPTGPEDDVRMSLVDHLNDLRKRLKYSAIALLVGVGLAYNFAEKILWWLMAPVLQALAELQRLHPHAASHPPQLAVHESMEYFVTILRVSFYAGLFIAAPVILYELWAFIAPGLYRKEKALAAPFVVGGSLAFLTGGLFARIVAMPYIMQYLIVDWHSKHLFQVFSIDKELDLVLSLVLSFGLVFEVPVVLALLAQIGLITSQFLRKYRRHAIIVNLVVAVFLAPSMDPVTQGLMAAPLVLCYEIGILATKVVERRKGAKTKAAAA